MPLLCGDVEGGVIVKEIKLDPRRLLGFRIIADGSAARLNSPKIGVKGCNTMGDANTARAPKA